MKIFEALEARRLRQVVPAGRFAMVTPEYEVQPADRPNHFQWRYGLQIWCMFVGPEESTAHNAKMAQRLIAQEVYGEICNDLLELMRILMNEQYRPGDDPAIDAIEKMLRKMRGE